MPTVTAPYVETQQVVTGFIYQLYIAEESQGRGITRLDIGPYFFEGALPRVKYPEAVTNEMCPPGWQGVRWFTDEAGASWLRWEGGILLPEDGEAIFQVTSNYPSSNEGAGLHVWHGTSKSPDRYAIAAPDYTQKPPKINTRHDVLGQKAFTQKGTGCAPSLVLMLVTVVGFLMRHWRA